MTHPRSDFANMFVLNRCLRLLHGCPFFRCTARIRSPSGATSGRRFLRPAPTVGRAGRLTSSATTSAPVLTWRRQAFERGHPMSVIAPDEKANFVSILHRHHLAETDFILQEAETIDVVDEVYPLRGSVTIIRKSSLREREYQTEQGTAWTVEFEKDLTQGTFG